MATDSIVPHLRMTSDVTDKGMTTAGDAVLANLATEAGEIIDAASVALLLGAAERA